MNGERPAAPQSEYCCFSVLDISSVSCSGAREPRSSRSFQSPRPALAVQHCISASHVSQSFLNYVEEMFLQMLLEVYCDTSLCNLSGSLPLLWPKQRPLISFFSPTKGASYPAYPFSKCLLLLLVKVSSELVF